MKLIVCSSVLAETSNYSNDPRMWHRYVLKLFNIFCWISPKLLLPWCTSFLTDLFHIYINGYFDIWNFIWYGRYFMHICGGLRLCCKVYTKHCQLQRPCGHKKVFTQTLLRQVITSRMIEKLIVIWWPQRFIVRNKSIEICLRLFQWIPSHWSWMVPCSETQYCSYAQVRKFVAVEEEQNSKDFACHKIET